MGLAAFTATAAQLLTRRGPPFAQVYDIKEFSASLELVESPLWLYDPAAHKNLWGNR